MNRVSIRLSAVSLFTGLVLTALAQAHSNTFPTSGNVWAETPTSAAQLHIQKDGAVASYYSLSQLFVGSTDGNKRRTLAFDTSNNVGLVQAYINGGAIRPIGIQAAGG